MCSYHKRVGGRPDTGRGGDVNTSSEPEAGRDGSVHITSEPDTGRGGGVHATSEPEAGARGSVSVGSMLQLRLMLQTGFLLQDGSRILQH